MTLKSVSDTDKTVVPLTDIERLRGRVSIEETLVNGFEMKKTHPKREMYLNGRNVEQIYRTNQDQRFNLGICGIEVTTKLISFSHKRNCHETKQRRKKMVNHWGKCPPR